MKIGINKGTLFVTCTRDNPVVDLENLTKNILSLKESGWQGGPKLAGAFLFGGN